MKKALIAIVIAIVVATAMAVMWQSIVALRTERDKYRSNTETLLSDVETYKVRDSLNAARVQSMEFTLKEYERFRSADAQLIRELKAKNRDLSAVNKTQSQTIIELQAIPRDTVIIRDSIKIPAISVHCGDAWFDFDGLLTKDTFTGTLANRDSLVIAESIKYKRFLGFLWKTKRVEDRRIDVVSKNPHTEIKNIEHITIETF